MPLVEWFRLWLFPPAGPTDARITQAPQTDDGMTPMVTAADIPADRRALLLGVQERHHEIINRLQGASARRQITQIQAQRQQEPPS